MYFVDTWSQHLTRDFKPLLKVSIFSPRTYIFSPRIRKRICRGISCILKKRGQNPSYVFAGTVQLHKNRYPIKLEQTLLQSEKISLAKSAHGSSYHVRVIFHLARLRHRTVRRVVHFLKSNRPEARTIAGQL